MQPFVEAKGSPDSSATGRAGLFVRADAIALGRGRTGADKAHNTGTIDERGKWDIHLGQARLNIRRGLREAIAQLGHLV